MADRIAVMYAGNIVEYTTADTLFTTPNTPYAGLLNCLSTEQKHIQTQRGTV